jgi:hypothetical protein
LKALDAALGHVAPPNMTQLVTAISNLATRTPVALAFIIDECNLTAFATVILTVKFYCQLRWLLQLQLELCHSIGDSKSMIYRRSSKSRLYFYLDENI